MLELNSKFDLCILIKVLIVNALIKSEFGEIRDLTISNRNVVFTKISQLKRF